MIDEFDLSAIEGVRAPPNLAFMAEQLKSEFGPIGPIVWTLQSAWVNGEPERILAFLIRDNPQLIAATRKLMGLDVLDWEASMLETAYQESSFAKLLIMSLCGVTRPAKDVFDDAFDSKNYPVLAYLLIQQGSEVANLLKDKWVDAYIDLENGGVGLPYMTAHMLNGVVCETFGDDENGVWEKGVVTIAERKNGVAVDYFKTQGRTFMLHGKQVVFNELVATAWDDHEE